MITLAKKSESSIRRAAQHTMNESDNDGSDPISIPADDDPQQMNHAGGGAIHSETSTGTNKGSQCSKRTSTQFDKRRFNNLIQRRQVLTHQRDNVRNHSWSNIQTSSVSIIQPQDPIENIINESDKTDDGNDVRNTSIIRERTSKSLTLLSQRIHQRRTTLHANANTNHLNPSSGNINTITKKRRSKYPERCIKQSSSLAKTDSHAMKALAELATRYKPPSPMSVAELERIRQKELELDEGKLQEREMWEKAMDYSFDLVTAAEDEGDRYGDDCSTALLTASLDDRIDFDEDACTSLMNRFISVDVMDEVSVDGTLGESSSNEEGDNNVDYLFQLSTLIGTDMGSSSSDEEECSSASLSSQVVYEVSAEHENDESVISPISFDCAKSTISTGRVRRCAMFRWCMLLWFAALLLVYERSISHEIYVISQRRRLVEHAFRKNFARGREKIDYKLYDLSKRAYQVKSATSSAMSMYLDDLRNFIETNMTRFMAVIHSRIMALEEWKSLVSRSILDQENVAETSTNEDAYLVCLESSDKEQEQDTPTEREETTSALDSYFYRDMMSSLDSEYVAVTSNEDTYLVFLESSDEEQEQDTPTEREETTSALDSYFYRDMMSSLHSENVAETSTNEDTYLVFLESSDEEQEQDTPTEREETTSALDSYFYRDMMSSLDSEYVAVTSNEDTYLVFLESSDEEQEQEQDTPTEREETTSALDSYFYRDMMACLDAIESNDNEDVHNLSIDGITNALEFMFHYDMTQGIQAINRDKVHAKENKEDDDVTTDALESMFYHDMTRVVETSVALSAPSTPCQFEFKHFWSTRPTNMPFIASGRDMSSSDLGLSTETNVPKASQHSDCFLSDVGENPALEEPSSLYCQYLFPETIKRNDANKALEYLNAKDDVDVDVPILDMVFDFFRVIRKARRQQRQQKKLKNAWRKKQHAK